MNNNIRKTIRDSSNPKSIFNEKLENRQVDHPSHYNGGGIECIDGIKAAIEGLEGYEAFCTANAIKYLWRWKRKGGAEDLKKAKWYIDYLLDHLPEAIQLLD